jgi:hypothetical protein
VIPEGPTPSVEGCNVSAADVEVNGFIGSTKCDKSIGVVQKFNVWSFLLSLVLADIHGMDERHKALCDLVFMVYFEEHWI